MDSVKFHVPKDLPPALVTALQETFARSGNRFSILVVRPDEEPSKVYADLHRNQKDADKKTGAVVFFCGGCIAPDAELEWRSWLIEREAYSRLIVIPDSEPPERWAAWVRNILAAWDLANDTREGTLVPVGSRVQFRGTPTLSHPQMMIVAPQSPMRHIQDVLDDIKRKYRFSIGSEVGVRRKKVHKPLLELVKGSGPEPQASSKGQSGRKSASGPGSTPANQASAKELHATVETALNENKFRSIQPGALPRILLRADSGSGKTLIARYLALRTSLNPDDKNIRYRPVKHISLPEYAGNEQNLEHDLFGYVAGSFTGAREGGSLGALLENMGGVIFLDEIGDASLTLQAKLLAFLDTYCVTPRGWGGEGIFCPAMIVAATNKPVHEWAIADERGEPSRFRHDLYYRFNRRIRLPDLNERKGELEWVIDAMMQTNEVNPRQRIDHVSPEALDSLKTKNYQQGNFRLLSRVLTEACRSAASGGRSCLLAGDVASAWEDQGAD